MLRRALSLVFWLFLVASSIVLFPVAVLIWAVTAPFDRRRALLHRFTCFWASLYTWLNPAWRVRVEGRDRIRPDAAYVMVANHQSLLDILVLFRLFVHLPGRRGAPSRDHHVSGLPDVALLDQQLRRDARKCSLPSPAPLLPAQA